MADNGFAARLAYIRWLRNRGRVKPETDGELANAVGVELGWLAKWKSRDDAPTDRILSRDLASGLGVDEAWLLDGRGEPPRPQLWGIWSEGASAPTADAQQVAAPALKETRASAASKSKAKGGKRGRAR